MAEPEGEKAEKMEGVVAVVKAEVAMGMEVEAAAEAVVMVAAVVVDTAAEKAAEKAENKADAVVVVAQQWVVMARSN